MTLKIEDTVLWRVGPGTTAPIRTAHAFRYGGGPRTACGLHKGSLLNQPTFTDRLCRKCCCAIGEHAWIGEDPEHCQDCGANR